MKKAKVSIKGATYAVELPDAKPSPESAAAMLVDGVDGMVRVPDVTLCGVFDSEEARVDALMEHARRVARDMVGRVLEVRTPNYAVSMIVRSADPVRHGTAVSIDVSAVTTGKPIRRTAKYRRW